MYRFRSCVRFDDRALKLNYLSKEKQIIGFFFKQKFQVDPMKIVVDIPADWRQVSSLRVQTGRWHAPVCIKIR
jgi:hypothetical protein